MPISLGVCEWGSPKRVDAHITVTPARCLMCVNDWCHPGPCCWHHSLRSWRDCAPILSWRRSGLEKAAKPPWKISPDTLPMSFECRDNDNFHPPLFSIIVFNIKICSFSVVKNKQTRPWFLVLEKFITCLPPEKPRDIAFIPSVLNRVQRLWASWIRSIVVGGFKIDLYSLFPQLRRENSTPALIPPATQASVATNSYPV